MESSADAGRALHFDRSAVVLDNFFRDVKAETSAALRLFRSEIRIENATYLRRGNAGTGVFHSKINIEILLRAFDRDAASVLGRSLQRVDDDVLNGSLDLHGIAQKCAR